MIVRATILVAGVYVAVIYAAGVLAPGRLVAVTGESGLVESLGALYFLVAAILCAGAWKRARSGAATLLLAGLLLVCFLEEISWGQHVLGLPVPDAIAAVNRQGELNLHNLVWFHGELGGVVRERNLFNLDRLFQWFCLGLCVLLPSLSRFHAPTRSRVRAYGLPLVPLGLGVLFAANYLLSKLAEGAVTGLPFHDAVVEIKEHAVAFLFMTAAVVWFFDDRTATRARLRGSVMPQRLFTRESRRQR